MTLFRFKAVAEDGKLVDGELEAENQDSVIRQLQATGHMPISASPKRTGLDLLQLGQQIDRWRKRPKATEITAITRELATLLNAGIPIDSSLRILGRHGRHAQLAAVLKKVHDDVHSGKALSSALAAHNEIFDPLYVNLVRAGEASGALDAVMQRLADYRERADAFRSSLISSLTYPIVLGCVAIVSLFVLMTFVIPRFIPLFDDAGGTLPMLTRLVFGTSALLQRFWLLPVVLLLAGKLAVDQWLANAANRMRFDRWILQAPIVGELIRSAETVRFARTLETLLSNGLPLLNGLKLVKQVVHNRIFAQSIEDCVTAVQSGRRLSETLQRSAVMPSLAVELVVIGEESGQLEEMLARTATTLENEVQQQLKRLLTLLEPALILGLGALIAIVIVSILMAMLGLNELVV